MDAPTLRREKGNMKRKADAIPFDSGKCAFIGVIVGMPMPAHRLCTAALDLRASSEAFESLVLQPAVPRGERAGG